MYEVLRLNVFCVLSSYTTGRRALPYNNLSVVVFGFRTAECYAARPAPISNHLS